MKFKAIALLAAALAALGAAARADPAPAAPKDPETLKIIVVESLVRGESRIADFDRINQVFSEVFSGRNWPLKVTVERFASNTPEGGTQLRVFYQGIYPEAPDDLTFHAWMILYLDGVKHDFGIVKYRYNPRASQSEDSILEHVVRGAAVIAADKIESAFQAKKGDKKP